MMGTKRAIRWTVALIPGVSIRALITVHFGQIDAFALLLALWGLLPYVLLASISSRLRAIWLFYCTLAILIATDMSAAQEGIWGSTSTSVIALAVQPLFAVIVLVPVCFGVNFLFPPREMEEADKP